MHGITNDIVKYFQKIINALKKIKPEIWLILILILALSIRLYYFIGINLNDDLCYLDTGYKITQGDFRFDEWIISPRIMMNYPIAFFFYLLGVSDFTGALYILLCSIGSVIVAYYIGKILFGTGTGLASAFLMAIFPIEVIYATTIVPDIPVAFFMGLSVCLFLYGEKKDNRIYYFLGGTAIGLAWLVKSLAILIILFYIIYFILDKFLDFKYLISKKKQKKYKKMLLKIF
jgi:4-amino-4-deoxy-L-arabinose transferase-like glycosyltransferase